MAVGLCVWGYPADHGIGDAVSGSEQRFYFGFNELRICGVDAGAGQMSR
jgi:hypothetical protein